MAWRRIGDFIYINSGLLLIGPPGTNLSGILVKIQNFSFINEAENIVCEPALSVEQG